jgi:hypothetical protein
MSTLEKVIAVIPEHGRMANMEFMNGKSFGQNFIHRVVDPHVTAVWRARVRGGLALATLTSTLRFPSSHVIGRFKGSGQSSSWEIS